MRLHSQFPQDENIQREKRRISTKQEFLKNPLLTFRQISQTFIYSFQDSLGRMAGSGLHFTFLLVSLLLIAGCLNPGSPSGSAVNPLPTNEPTVSPPRYSHNIHSLLPIRFDKHRQNSTQPGSYALFVSRNGH